MDPMCQTKDGSTPLHKACHDSDIGVIEYLVNAMCKYLPLEDVVRCKGKDGRAPLHSAALFGHLEVVKFFITKLNCDPLTTTDLRRVFIHYSHYLTCSVVSQ